MILTGQKIKLRPMTEDEKSLFFDMTTKSEATAYLFREMYGTKVPTWDELFGDYKEYYFDGSEPEKGRCFAILLEDRIIGQINYNEIDRKKSSVELDIWIAKEDDAGKGAGCDAMKTLIEYLHDQLKVDNFFVFPSVKNPRAVRCYQNAGFKVLKKSLNDRGKEICTMERKF